MTITTHEAKTHLSRYLAKVENGEEIVIARGRKPVARLVPLDSPHRSPRPKVGELAGERFPFPPEATAPLSPEESRAWGL